MSENVIFVVISGRDHETAKSKIAIQGVL